MTYILKKFVTSIPRDISGLGANIIWKLLSVDPAKGVVGQVWNLLEMQLFNIHTDRIPSLWMSSISGVPHVNS